MTGSMRKIRRQIPLQATDDCSHSVNLELPRIRSPSTCKVTEYMYTEVQVRPCSARAGRTHAAQSPSDSSSVPRPRVLARVSLALYRPFASSVLPFAVLLQRTCSSRQQQTSSHTVTSEGCSIQALVLLIASVVLDLSGA